MNSMLSTLWIDDYASRKIPLMLDQNNGAEMDLVASMRAFVTIARLGSFARAADELRVSRASLSRVIADLERRTGTRLFNRTTRHVSLSPDAEGYCRECENLLLQIDQVERRLSERQNGDAGQMSIAVHSIVMQCGIWSILNRYRRDHPDVSLEIVVRSGVLNLEESDFDLAIYPQQMISNATIINRPLLASRYMLVASPSLLPRIAVVKDKISLDGCLIAGVDLNQGRRRVGEIDSLGDYNRGSHISVSTDATSAVNIALSGEGLAWVPECIVRSELRQRQLVSVGHSNWGDPERIEVGLQYRDAKLVPRRVRRFIELCVDAYRSGLPPFEGEDTFRLVA
ncbi:LysR family transcriptional regulator [Paraburkholderia strydomiana]